MRTISTKYGSLQGISSIEFFDDGSIKGCMVTELNELVTPLGVLVPQFETDKVRRKYTSSVTFYNNGNIRSMALHRQTPIPTSLGKFPAELLTFYENGNLKRLFPLNGKISAYWTEEDEYCLAQELDFDFSFGNFKKKVIALYFYESGSVKGLTFWPGDSVDIHSPIGEVKARIGITLYPDGQLKSFEPNAPVTAATPIGAITAYNPDAIGIHGDMNSFVFYEDGRIKSLMSSHNLVTITDQNGRKEAVSPRLKRSLLHDSKIDIVPLSIIFNDNTVRLGNSFIKQYNLNNCTFTIYQIPQIYKPIINGCSSCDKCG
jgi:hypothetical protein